MSRGFIFGWCSFGNPAQIGVEGALVALRRGPERFDGGRQLGASRLGGSLQLAHVGLERLLLLLLLLFELRVAHEDGVLRFTRRRLFSEVGSGFRVRERGARRLVGRRDCGGEGRD